MGRVIDLIRMEVEWNKRRDMTSIQISVSKNKAVSSVKAIQISLEHFLSVKSEQL